MRTALKRVCDENNSEVTLTVKTIKNDKAGQAYASVDIDNTKCMALIPNTPKTKPEKDEIDAALQVAFNEFKKNPCAMTKGILVDVADDYTLASVLK